MRYADPRLCPDCRGDLPSGVPACPSCSLLVRHPLAVDLFRTLRRADELVGDLRAATDAFHDRPAAATHAAGGVRATTLGGPMHTSDPTPKLAATAPLPPLPPLPPPPRATAPLPHYPVVPASRPLPAAPGLDLSSIPKILLGLGAFCLLVAALIFLAVSWSGLGVGGRTAILGAFTLTTAGAAFGLHRAGLRIAGESLIVVALGMVTLDVFGGGAAWFPGLSDAAITAIAGATVLIASTAAGLVRVGRQPRLVAPQVIAGIGLLLVHSGGAAALDHPLTVAHVVSALAVALAIVGIWQRCSVLAWSVTVAGGLAWLAGAGIATTQAIDEPSLHQLWAEGSGWSLLLSAAFLLAPGALLRHRVALLTGGSCAAMIASAVVTLPCVDTNAATVGLVALFVTAAWVAALALFPAGLRTVAIAPAAAGALILVGMSLITVGIAITRWGHSGEVFSAEPGVRLSSPEPLTEPLLLVPSLAVTVLFIALLAPNARTAQSAWLATAAVTIGTGTAASLASYDVVLAGPLAVLTVVAIGAAVLATRSPRLATAAAIVAVSLGAVTAIGAVPSAVLTAVFVTIAAVVAVLVAVLAAGPAARVAAGIAVAPQLALAVAACVHVASPDRAWIAIPVLIAVSLAALALPRAEVEVPAIVVAVLTLPVSIEAASEPTAYVALWLATAGFACCSSALIHEHRRGAMWPGAALFLLASWVRLADLQVQAPEAYTLPLAAALCVFGVWRLRTEADADTMTSLLPGLLLGTVPSLLWVLDDPVSLRALFLGGACLALTIAGACLRWKALLVVGGCVGAIVVLREIGPYSGDIPKWVWIGLAGLLLTTVGITWERRLVEVRTALGFVGRLR